MKKIQILLSLLLLAAVPFATAAEHSDAMPAGEHTTKAGPNGGRIIHAVEPNVEFFVREDGKVQLSVLNEAGEVVSAGGLEASLIGGKRSAPVRIAFEADGEVLLSGEALPELVLVPVVLSLKHAGGERVRVKFNVSLGQCGSCDYQEYACICGH